MRKLLAVGGLLVAVAALVAPPAGSSSAVYVAFRTPSGNIGCGYSKFSGEPAYLRCEIVSRLKPTPPKKGTCDGVWGRAVGMQRTGAAGPLCISDTVMEPSASVLGYGRTWARGGFTCVSRTSGLTCTNASRHGWLLSRERSRIF